MSSPEVRAKLEAQLDSALRYHMNLTNLGSYAAPRQSPTSQETNRLLLEQAAAFVSAAVSAIQAITGRDSERSVQARRYAEQYSGTPTVGTPANFPPIARLKGLVDETRSALLADYLIEHTALIRAELFTDFLEMAEHLLEQHYYDQATTTATGVLEQHMRALAARYNVSLVDDKGERKGGARLNDDLRKAQAYDAAEHQEIHGWLKMRNPPSHGEFRTFDEQRASLLIQGVRAFINRHPA
jgi:hypothetical protein